MPGAGEGLFTGCSLNPGQVISRMYQGERRSQAQMIGDVGSADQSYVWCPEKVGRLEVECVDAKNSKGLNNPLRYVNSARGEEQCQKLSLEMCQFDYQLFFRTTRRVPSGAEFLVDYGSSYWGQPQCLEASLPAGVDKDEVLARLDIAFKGYENDM